MPISRNGKADLLNKIPLFSECSGAELEAVAAVTDEIRLPAGRVLMRQGTAGRELLVLVDGEVTVARAGATIAVRGSGDFIGKLALVTHTAPLRDGAGCDPAATYIRDPHARGMELASDLRIEERELEAGGSNYGVGSRAAGAAVKVAPRHVTALGPILTISSSRHP